MYVLWVEIVYEITVEFSVKQLKQTSTRIMICIQCFTFKGLPLHLISTSEGTISYRESKLVAWKMSLVFQGLSFVASTKVFCLTLLPKATISNLFLEFIHDKINSKWFDLGLKFVRIGRKSVSKQVNHHGGRMTSCQKCLFRFSQCLPMSVVLFSIAIDSIMYRVYHGLFRHIHSNGTSIMASSEYCTIQIWNFASDTVTSERYRLIKSFWASKASVSVLYEESIRKTISTGTVAQRSEEYHQRVLIY